MRTTAALVTRARDHRVARALCRVEDATSRVVVNDCDALAANDVVANDVATDTSDVRTSLVTKLVGVPVDGNWMISVEKSLRAVTHPVGHPVNQTWTFLDAELVHKFGSCHPPNTDDVRPSCCGYESFVTPRGC